MNTYIAWIKSYKKKEADGFFDNMSKFRRAEWDACYELALQQTGEPEKENF
jgi:hypothetical protein